MKHILIFTAIQLLLAFLFCEPTTLEVQAASGDLDLTFGTGGKVLTQIGTSQDEGRAMAIQTDGKIVVAGFTDPGFFVYDFAVVRYNTDGSLDTTFGTGGKITTNFGFNGSAQTSEQAFALAIQTNGKIVVAGQSNFTGNNQNYDFAIVRYNSDGSLDNTFGNGGKVTTPIGTANEVANSIVLQGNGKIVAVGSSDNGAGSFNAAVVRYNSDGTLDTTFNGTGKITTPIVGGGSTSGVKLQSDGKIVTVGTASQGGSVGFALVRYNTDGSLDNNFGIQFYPVSSNGYFANALTLQTDDKIVVFGNESQSAISGFDMTVFRLGASGGVDTSFGNSGKVTTPISANRADKAYTGVIQPNGKIIAAGSAQVGTANDENFALVRYNSNGSLDTTFGTGGIVTTGISATDNEDVIYGVALQIDGKIVTAGQSRSIGASGGAQDFALTRYLGDAPLCFPVLMPQQTVYRNALTTIPVNISGDTTGQGIYSFDFTLTFDSNVLDFQFPNPGGTTSAGFTVMANETLPGTLRVSGFGTSPMNGTGMMLKLNFIPIGAIGTNSVLNLTNFQLNEGSPCSMTQNGQATVIGGSISGTITYGTSVAVTPVANVTVTATGTPTVSHTTGANGNYQLGSLGTGAYTVTPSKTSDVNGISALDASLVVQHLVGISILTPNQQSAGDTSGNGSLSSFDASLIARFVIGAPNTLLAGTWKFLPSNRIYNNITSDLTNENYTAILVGEVSGNWTPPSAFSAENTAENQVQMPTDGLNNLNQPRISVSLPKITVSPNSLAIIPIKLENYGGQSITAYQFDLIYQPEILALSEIPVVTIRTLSNDFAVETNTLEPGRLRVAVYGANSISGDGTLLNLQFRVIGQSRRSSLLNWQEFQFNEGFPFVKANNGKVSIR